MVELVLPKNSRVQQGKHHAAPAGLARPGLQLEAAGFARIELGRRLVFQAFELGRDAVAQGGEPVVGGEAPGVEIAEVGIGGHGAALWNPSVWRNASARPMAAAVTTFSERAPGAKGMKSRASAT